MMLRYFLMLFWLILLSGTFATPCGAFAAPVSVGMALPLRDAVLSQLFLEQPVAPPEAGQAVPASPTGGGLLAIPEHDTFESIALADWMLRLAFLLAVLFAAGFATVLAFVPWLIRVRGPQRAVYLVYSLIVRTYYLLRHLLWTVRWPLLGAFVVLLCLLFVYFLSAGTETLLE